MQVGYDSVALAVLLGHTRAHGFHIPMWKWNIEAAAEGAEIDICLGRFGGA